MKIFITGLAGFLGSNLGTRLADKGHIIFGNDNFIGGYKDNLDSRFNFFDVDCCDLNNLTKVIPNDIDLVFHCAATAYEGLSVFSPSFVTKNIFEASVSTVTASIQKKVKKDFIIQLLTRVCLQQNL